MSNLRQNGFTLLETLVAFSILSIALGIFYSAVSTSMQRQSGLDEDYEAMSLAEAKLTEAGHEYPLKDAIFNGSEGDFNWVMTIEGQPDPDSNVWLYQVTTTVKWRDSGKAQAISVETLKLGPRGDADG